MYNKKFMEKIVSVAKEIKEDIPVCVLIEKNGEIISIAVNEKEKKGLTAAHAEILAIEKANKKLNSWRLEDCSMYVTLEPCPMCAWAILSSRIKNVYFGAYDTQYGAFGGRINLLNLGNFKTKTKGGFLESECNNLLSSYFEKLRK